MGVCASLAACLCFLVCLCLLCFEANKYDDDDDDDDDVTSTEILMKQHTYIVDALFAKLKCHC